MDFGHCIGETRPSSFISSSRVSQRCPAFIRVSPYTRCLSICSCLGAMEHWLVPWRSWRSRNKRKSKPDCSSIIAHPRLTIMSRFSKICSSRFVSWISFVNLSTSTSAWEKKLQSCSVRHDYSAWIGRLLQLALKFLRFLFTDPSKQWKSLRWSI